MMEKNAPVARVTRSKKQARSSYDRLSSCYDWLAGSSERSLRELALQKLNAQPGERVLEIGFGTGHGVLALARAVGDTGSAYGIDLSPRMCEMAGARLRAAGLAHSVTLICGDAAHLPLMNHSCDAILMTFALELFDTPEIPLVLAECRRVLRAGGRVGIAAMSRPERPGWTVRLYEWAHNAFPTTVDCRPIHVQPALLAAGFRIVQAVPSSMWGLPVEVVLAASQTRRVWET